MLVRYDLYSVTVTVIPESIIFFSPETVNSQMDPRTMMMMSAMMSGNDNLRNSMMMQMMMGGRGMGGPGSMMGSPLALAAGGNSIPI